VPLFAGLKRFTDESIAEVEAVSWGNGKIGPTSEGGRYHGRVAANPRAMAMAE